MIQVAAHFPLSPTSPSPSPCPAALPLTHTEPTHTQLNTKQHRSLRATLVTEKNAYLTWLSSAGLTASTLPAASLALLPLLISLLSFPLRRQALTHTLNHAPGNAKHLLPLWPAYGIGNRKKNTLTGVSVAPSQRRPAHHYVVERRRARGRSGGAGGGAPRHGPRGSNP